MKIIELCNLLRDELVGNGYEYGFIVDGQKYKPDIKNGFDEEFFYLAKTISRVQDPALTRKEKVGTCIDIVLVMRQIIDEYNILSKIWLLYHRKRNKVHTILTFEAEGKTVYLELTPQSIRPWYGQEIVYSNEWDFLWEQENHGYEISNVTDKVIIGERPYFLLEKLK